MKINDNAKCLMCPIKKSKAVIRLKHGISRQAIEHISSYKREPVWMRNIRLKGYKSFLHIGLPTWAQHIVHIDLHKLCYYLKPIQKTVSSWQDLPKTILDVYEAIGIPKAERTFLAGVNAQYESEIVYKSLQKSLSDKGVIFVSMDEAVKKYPDIVRTYMGTIVPMENNKFAALNTAAWSGGTFLYVPKGVHIELPLQAYFRMNAQQLGQFERTLIIAEEGSFVHYIEGCTAQIYLTDSLHAGVVEVLVKKGARVRYTTIQNWSTNVYNLVTKRAKVEEEGVVEWVDGNIGSKVTMKHPSVFLVGKKARCDIFSLTYAGAGQYQDTGAKAIHIAPETTSRIIAKSVCKHGGISVFRGYVKIAQTAVGAKSNMSCHSLLLDEHSKMYTHPSMEIQRNNVEASHEAIVSRIQEDQIFYLTSRGISQDAAISLIVNGFIEPIVKELPLEYAVELNKLIALQMEGSVG